MYNRAMSDPRVDSTLANTVILTTPECTYSMRYTKTTNLRAEYPVLIFNIKYANGTRIEIIPEVNTSAVTWNNLYLATITPNTAYKYNGKCNDPLQISACDAEVLFISDGEAGICPRGRMQIFVPAAAGAGWFKIAHRVVGTWETIIS